MNERTSFIDVLFYLPNFKNQAGKIIEIVKSFGEKIVFKKQ